MADIFISYTAADRDWAFWIGLELEKLGHVPRVHEWEIGAGGDISRWMEERHDSADHILCVVSDAYLKAPYSSWERRAAQWAAATERPNFALPVFIESCKAPTLFAPIKRCDLHGLSEDEARVRLEEFMKPSTKPTGPWAFPGAKRAFSGDKPSDPVIFPGKAESGRVGTISNNLDDARHAPDEHHDGLTVAKTFPRAIDEAAKVHPAAEPLNREVLAWFGGGLVVVATGAWAVFVYVVPPDAKKSTASTTTIVTQSGNGIASGGNTTISAPVHIGPDEKKTSERLDALEERMAAQIAREKGVPVAPLRKILIKLREAGFSDEAMPQRLDAKADELIKLRGEIAQLRQGSEVASILAQALIDQGDLDGARAALAEGRAKAHNRARP
jgi:hypothetical protein